MLTEKDASIPSLSAQNILNRLKARRDESEKAKERIPPEDCLVQPGDFVFVVKDADEREADPSMNGYWIVGEVSQRFAWGFTINRFRAAAGSSWRKAEPPMQTRYEHIKRVFHTYDEAERAAELLERLSRATINSWLCIFGAWKATLSFLEKGEEHEVTNIVYEAEQLFNPTEGNTKKFLTKMMLLTDTDT